MKKKIFFGILILANAIIALIGFTTHDHELFEGGMLMAIFSQVSLHFIWEEK